MPGSQVKPPRRPPAAADPKPESPSEAGGLLPALGEAVEPAAERLAALLGTPVPQAHDTVAQLAELVALRHGGVRAAVDPHSIARRACDALDILWTETLKQWCGGGEPPGAAPLGLASTVFEELKAELSPDASRQLTGRLAGSSGLELVVEVAHDLRSPLTSILFLAETLNRGHSGAVNQLQQRQLGLIYSAALGLSTLSSNLLELAHGGDRLVDDRPVPFSITDMLDSVVDIVRPMAEEKGLVLRVSHPATDHRLGFPQALSRVLLNLTTNALKFTEEGSVEIAAHATSLSGVEFSVRDTGEGIRDEALPTLFLPFRPGQASRPNKFSGTGLGLALCRKLVEAMRSDLKLETKDGWGTRFYFTLELPPVQHLQER
jgi:signal transduction histidine kinase